MVRVIKVSIATWNLNHRVGKTPFHLESAYAAAALKTDIVVLTEFYPRKHLDYFRGILADQGLPHQILSLEGREIANRVLIASRFPIKPSALPLPRFDHQFPANIACAELPLQGLNIVGLRMPAYRKNASSLLADAWRWVENTAHALSGGPALIAGDLNISATSTKSRAGKAFQHLLSSGWASATPVGSATYFGINGKSSAIDHILSNQHGTIRTASVITQTDTYLYAGSVRALSDHGALVCEAEFTSREDV